MPAQSKLISSLVAFCVLSNYQAFGDRSISQISALQLNRAKTDTTRIGKRARVWRFVKTVFGGEADTQAAAGEIELSSENPSASRIQALVQKYKVYSKELLNSMKPGRDESLAPKMQPEKTSEEIYAEIFGDLGTSRSNVSDGVNVFRMVGPSVFESIKDKRSIVEGFEAAAIVLKDAVNMSMSENEYLNYVANLEGDVMNNRFRVQLRQWLSTKREQQLNGAQLDLAQEVLYVCLFEIKSIVESKRFAAYVLSKSIRQKQQRSSEERRNDAIVSLKRDTTGQGKMANIQRLIDQQRAEVSVQELTKALRDARYTKTIGEHDVESDEEKFVVEVTVLAGVINETLTRTQYKIFLHLVRNRERHNGGDFADQAAQSLLDMMLRLVYASISLSETMLESKTEELLKSTSNGTGAAAA